MLRKSVDQSKLRCLHIVLVFLDQNEETEAKLHVVSDVTGSDQCECEIQNPKGLRLRLSLYLPYAFIGLILPLMRQQAFLATHMHYLIAKRRT